MAVFSRPSSVALPIKVIGVRRLQNLVRLGAFSLAASSHILRTNETGSTGALVLKKITEASISRAMTCGAGLLTALNIQLY